MLDPLSWAREASDAATFERRVLEEMQAVIGCDAAFFAFKGDPPTTIAVDAAKLDTAMTRADYVSEISPLKQAALANGGVAVDTTVFGETAVRKLHYHRDFVVPARGRHTLLAFLSLRGRELGGLMLGRSGRKFALAELDHVRALLPDLTMARVSFRAPWAPGDLREAPVDPWNRLRALAGRAHRLERVQLDRDVVEIRDSGDYREMVAIGEQGEFVWSRADRHDPKRSGWFYVDLFHLAAARAKQRSSVLVVGCGGGVIAHQLANLYPGTAIDIVERHAAVIDLARRWYGLDQIPNLKIIIEDARQLLARTRAPTWDVAIIDAYGAVDLAPGFADASFFADLRRTLRPGGAFAFNVVGALAGDGPVRQIERAARRAFGDVRLVPVLDAGEAFSPFAVRNVVLLGRSGGA